MTAPFRWDDFELTIQLPCPNNHTKDWLMLPLGLPKGAMLSNAAMASTTYAVSIMLKEIDFVPEDVNISYLPASHVFERELQVK